MKTTLMLLALAASAFGQTAALPTTAVADITLPTYIMAGASCNQFQGCAGFVSGIVPETSKVGGLYGSVTADINAAKITDPTTGKTGYGISPSFRFGQHKVVYNDTKTVTTSAGVVTSQKGNMLLVGGDFGASFTQTQTTTTTPLGTTTSTSGTSGLNIGLAGSFTVTYIRQLSQHWAIAIPVRMLWMAGVGPNGTGVWNPVVEAGVVWKP